MTYDPFHAQALINEHNTTKGIPMDLALLNGLKFKEALRQIRLSAGMSQTKLAELAEVAQPVVSCWERGEHFPSIERLAKLEVVFGLTKGDLLTRAAYEMLESHRVLSPYQEINR
jgi:transcriptional regulator with XRE-family HTH domain